MQWFSPRRFACLSLTLVMVCLASSDARAEPLPLKIGVVYSYTGAPEYIGRGLDAAIKAYMTLHGDRAAGRKVLIVKRDDTGIAPEIARRMAQELIIQENVDILIGATTTPNAIAIADVSTQAKKPFFIVNAATSGIIAKNPYTVRFSFTTAQLTVPFAKWVYQNGMKSAYLMYQDYGPGIDAGSAFRRSFEAEGGSILGEARVPLTNQDFSAYIQKVRDSKAQALYGFFNYIGGVQMLKAAATAGLIRDGTKILSTDSLVSESDLDSIGDITLGLTSVSNYTYTHGSALNRQFVRAFRKAYGSETEVPTFADVAGFDVMNVIYTIAEKLGGNLDPDKTLALARGMQFESPRGPISIDPATRDIIENVYIVRVQRQNGHNIGVEIQTIPAVKDPNEH